MEGVKRSQVLQDEINLLVAGDKANKLISGGKKPFSPPNQLE